MALVKLNLNAPVVDGWSMDLQQVHVLDLERTPYALKTWMEDGLLVCQTATPESLRVQVPWALPGFDPVILGTSTLPSRPEPYLLVLELARGRLTELRHHFQDGPAIGNSRVPDQLRQAHNLFVQAVLCRNETGRCAELATRCLALCLDLGRSQFVNMAPTDDLDSTITDKLSIDLTGIPVHSVLHDWALRNVEICKFGPRWRDLMQLENKIDWAAWEAPVCQAHEAGLTVHAGPLIDFSEAALPTWLSRYDDTFQLSRVIANYIFYVVRNLKNRVHVWHVVRRPAMGTVCGLTEEQQIKLTVAAIQAVTQAAPEAEVVVDLTAPWAEWLSHASFELGPLHMADTLARADLGLTGIGLELALGYPYPGSHQRELIDISRMLDLYQLINLPLHLNLAIPSQLRSPTVNSVPGTVFADPRQWPGGCSPEQQARHARKIMELAARKNSVKTISWSSLSDLFPTEFLYSGLFDTAGNPKPLALELERLHKERNL